MKQRIALSLMLMALAYEARAQVVLSNTSGSESATKTWTLTGLDQADPTVSTGNGIVTGTVSGAGELSGSEQFSLTASARYGWSTAAAQLAAADDTLGSYLSGLTPVGIGAINSGEYGVDASSATLDVEFTRFSDTNEVLVLTMDASGLGDEATLLFQRMSFQLYTAPDRSDFLVFDVSANRLLEAQWNANYNGADAVSGSWALAHGDQILVATGSENTDIFRIDDVTFDVVVPVSDTEPPTPDPARWASAPAAIGPHAISMSAEPGADASSVEYFFAETSGNPGGSDSGWQSMPWYADTGLTAETSYTYTIQMRDTAGHTGTVSAASGAVTPAATGRTNGPPNVVILYADDLGYADISRNASSGSLVHTPEIDRLCNQGIYLSSYLTHHVCSPSRAGLLTGRHYSEVGVGVATGGTLDNSIANIAKDFRGAGYVTGAFGKWHNGEPPLSADGASVYVSNLSGVNPTNALYEMTPGEVPGEGVNAYGFDEWAGFYGGGHDYHDRINARQIDWWVNGVYAPATTGYNTYIIRDDALGFIDDNADQPFFLYVPMEAVHGPYDILNTDLRELCNIVSRTHPSLAWNHVKELVSPQTGRRIEDVVQMHCSGGAEFDRDALDAQLPGIADLAYYTLAYALDKATGQILDRLAAHGLSSNTIVVFAADNGGTKSGDNTPFRGNKHQLWEGGVHVVAAIWWPGTLDAHHAPYSPGDNVYSHVTQYIDWYPTLMAAAGATVTASELDGLNLVPHLTARTPARAGYDNGYYGLDDSWAAIRTDRWKLHFNRVPGNQMLELYDLDNDISEVTNVAAAYPVERDTLIGLLDAWFASGDVTASYMPLTGNTIPPYLDPAPAGEILEITATQTDALGNPDKYGVYIRFAEPVWSFGMDQFVHAGDVLQYDIYVAEDSAQVQGLFVSPSSGPNPIYDSDHGIGLDGNLLVKQVLPKGQWIRRVAGMGDVAPNTAYATFIGLHTSAPGYYHFYIDNVVVRKNDGTVRAVAWNSHADTRNTLWYIVDKTKFTTLEAALADPDFSYSDITLNAVDLSTIPSAPPAGSSYGEWAEAIGGIGSFDPAGAGPTNEWPLVLEYALGSDATTPTTGWGRGTNAPTSEQLGTYTVQNLLVDSQYKDYLTFTFDFNREASDIEFSVSESTNLLSGGADLLVLRPPYTDTSPLTTNEAVVDVSDNAPGDYPVDTTRVTARTTFAIEEEADGFLRLTVRSAVAPAEAPLTLNADAHRGILLEWNGVAEQGEFIIERAPAGSGVFVQVASTDNGLYTDATAVVGQSYDYRVRAMNAAGASAWSNIATVTQ